MQQPNPTASVITTGSREFMVASSDEVIDHAWIELRGSTKYKKKAAPESDLLEIV